jgi:predicted amidophosphoribosyltransferase
MKTINSTLSYLYHLLFPPHCVGCSISGSAFCSNCFKRLKRATLIPVKNCIALYPYKDPSIKTTLWEAKYHHHTKPLETLMKRSIEDIFEYVSSYTLSEETVPLVFIPIPTSTHRKNIRGYNVPTLMAKILAKETGGVCIDALYKTRETIPQSKTPSRESRINNVSHSLALQEKKQLPSNALIILVDDIITSGATAQEAQRACREQGYEAIVVALAHGS